MASSFLTTTKDKAVLSIHDEYMYMLMRGSHCLQRTQHTLQESTAVADLAAGALPFDASGCSAYHPLGLMVADTSQLCEKYQGR